MNIRLLFIFGCLILVGASSCFLRFEVKAGNISLEKNLIWGIAHETVKISGADVQEVAVANSSAGVVDSGSDSIYNIAIHHMSGNPIHLPLDLFSSPNQHRVNHHANTIRQAIAGRGEFVRIAFPLWEIGAIGGFLSILASIGLLRARSVEHKSGQSIRYAEPFR